jgi:hypothetical protein
VRGVPIPSSTFTNYIITPAPKGLHVGPAAWKSLDITAP